LADKRLKDDILVYLEVDHGELAEVSMELISKARDLANQLKVNVIAMLSGSGVKKLKKIARPAIKYGANTVYFTADERLKYYETKTYAHVAVEIIRFLSPQIVLFGATPLGRDLAPRVASSLKTGLTADCTDLRIGDHENKREGKTFKDILYQIRPAFGGNIIATIIAPEHRPQMATVRDGVIKLGKPLKGHTGDILPFNVNLKSGDHSYIFEERLIAEKKIDLKKADIIVAGGGGVASKEKFQLIYDLAAVLGARVGASRAAVDNGYISRDHQVGQTGTTIRPKLYIACGISGAIQHQAGMDQSSKIIAINNDPNAPIFQIAHYGIVGDLHEVIPMMIKAYKRKS
jgi:electron transfer flavoprotein alpha subunit